MCLTMGFLQLKCRARMCARRLSRVTWVTAGTLQQDRFCFRCTWGPFKCYVGVERGRRPTNAGDQEHSRIIQLDRDLSTLVGLSPRATTLSSILSSLLSSSSSSTSSSNRAPERVWLRGGRRNSAEKASDSPNRACEVGHYISDHAGVAG